MSQEESNCLKCGLSKRSKKKGSITQWIALCKCDLKEEDSSSFSQYRVCRICDKRIKSGRSGSMTQWIFRSDLCDCEQPNPQDSKIDNSRVSSQDSINPVDDDELEIEVDESMFPLDRYKPLKELGKGSVGLVYLCRDRMLGVKVAIKCLSTISAESLVAFQKEAKVTSKLEHSNIVRVIDFGASQTGAPYMVMEYVDGVTLKELIASQGPLPIEKAIHFISLICTALFYAHSKGIFHRDLTSSNIIVSESDGEVRLVDFGIAMALNATQEPTIVQGRTVAGTPAYMSPDQVKGYEYTERSEVYSLGCVLFESLTGQAPFIGETALEVIGMHASKELPDPCSFRKELSKLPKVVEIIEKALSKEPEDRYQSMDEFESALRTSLEDKTVESPKSQPIVSGEGVKSGTKNFVFIGMSVFFLLGAIAGILILVNRLPGMFTDNPKITAKFNDNLSEELITTDLKKVKTKEDSFTQKSLDLIIGEPKLGPGKVKSNKLDDKNVKCPGVTRFSFKSIMYQSCYAHLAGDKVRFDWQAVMAFFVIAPNYDTLLVQDLISVYSYSMPVKDYYYAQWKHKVDQKVEAVKYLGEEELIGVKCKKYSCLIDGVRMKFSACKGLTKDSRLEDTCARILGVPPGYGIPLVAYKFYKPGQVKNVEFDSVRNRILNSPGTNEKVVLWFKMNSIERNISDLPLKELFPPKILKGEVDTRR